MAKKNEELTKIKGIISLTSSWNGGQGLIVSPAIGAKLRELGINEGYIETRWLPNDKLSQAYKPKK